MGSTSPTSVLCRPPSRFEFHFSSSVIFGFLSVVQSLLLQSSFVSMIFHFSSFPVFHFSARCSYSFPSVISLPSFSLSEAILRQSTRRRKCTKKNPGGIPKKCQPPPICWTIKNQRLSSKIQIPKRLFQISKSFSRIYLNGISK